MNLIYNVGLNYSQLGYSFFVFYKEYIDNFENIQRIFKEKIVYKINYIMKNLKSK